VEYLKKNGITALAAFVLGFPGETEKTIQDDIDFIESQGIDFYTLKEFYYLQNTPVHKKREFYGLTGSGDRWTHHTMDSEAAHGHKINMFKQIKGSTFIDPDTSLWYLAYLYDRGFSLAEIAEIQGGINSVVASQIDGGFDDNHPALIRLQEKLDPKRGLHP
jgi:p-methyltransferase